MGTTSATTPQTTSTMRELISYLDACIALDRPAGLSPATGWAVVAALRWYDAVTARAAAMRLEPSCSPLMRHYNVTCADAPGEHGETVLETSKLEVALLVYEKLAADRLGAFVTLRHGIRVIRTTMSHGTGIGRPGVNGKGMLIADPKL